VEVKRFKERNEEVSRIFKKIYQLVKLIPKGKVVTYGEIAKKLGVNPRVVGWALHANKHPGIPCHRVVNKFGKIAKNYRFGGARIQRKKLLSEAIKFKNDKHILASMVP